MSLLTCVSYCQTSGLIQESLEWPADNTNAEPVTMAAADTLYEIMSVMIKKSLLGVLEIDSED